MKNEQVQFQFFISESVSDTRVSVPFVPRVSLVRFNFTTLDEKKRKHVVGGILANVNERTRAVRAVPTN